MWKKSMQNNQRFITDDWCKNTFKHDKFKIITSYEIVQLQISPLKFTNSSSILDLKNRFWNEKKNLTIWQNFMWKDCRKFNKNLTYFSPRKDYIKRGVLCVKNPCEKFWDFLQRTAVKHILARKFRKTFQKNHKSFNCKITNFTNKINEREVHLRFQKNIFWRDNTFNISI